MRSSLLLAVLSAFTLGSMTCAEANPSPLGRWETVDDSTGRATGTIVEITSSGDTLVGRIIKLAPKPGHSTNPLCTKCEGELHNAPVIGLPFIAGLKRDGDEWDGGTILDPDSGSTYSCEVHLADGGNKLVVRGYFGISLIGRSQTWIRQE